MKALLLTTVAALGLALAPPAAKATDILNFTQAITGDTVAATVSGFGSSRTTTIATIGSVEVSVDCLGCGVLPTTLFTLSAKSTGPADVVRTSPFDVFQPYSGTFSFKAGSVNVLSGTFNDGVFGGGTSLTLSASDATPGENVTFTSDIIKDLSSPRGFSLSFADVSPAITSLFPSGCDSTPGCTLPRFTSSVSGTASATAAHVPEPATLALLGTGLVGFGLLRRRGRA